MEKSIYLVETVAFIDGYWGYAYSPKKAFTTKEAAEQYLSSLKKEGRIVKIELVGVIHNKIYRVRTFSNVEEKIESTINLPGWRNSNTGFWTTELDCAIRIWKDRNKACILYNGGGGTWAGIVETDITNVVTADPSTYKTGHDDRYDEGEIFVVEVKDETKIKRIQ